jgi:hypothetical protein
MSTITTQPNNQLLGLDSHQLDMQHYGLHKPYVQFSRIRLSYEFHLKLSQSLRYHMIRDERVLLVRPIS